MGAAICMKLSCLYMYACVHTCVGHPPKHPDRVPPTIHPPLPPPMGGTPEISQKSIKIKRIKIFEFCLKILDL